MSAVPENLQPDRDVNIVVRQLWDPDPHYDVVLRIVERVDCGGKRLEGNTDVSYVAAYM